MVGSDFDAGPEDQPVEKSMRETNPQLLIETIKNTTYRGAWVA